MLFPSGDPFAYPSQPTIDFGLQDLVGHGTGSGGDEVGATVGGDGGGSGDGQRGPGGVVAHGQQQQQQQQDAMQFYTSPGIFGDIEGQLLGPVPAYLMPQSDGALPTGVDLASEMYNASSLLTLQQSQVHNAQQQQQAAHAHHQQQQRHRELDELFADNDFGNIFSGQFERL